MTHTTPDSWTRANRHWKDRFWAWGARRMVRPMLSLPTPWVVHRAVFEAAGRARFKAQGVEIKALPADLGPGLSLSPPHPQRRIVWVHGGGFTVGSPRCYAAPLSQLAVLANAKIYAPKYRLAPEHPFPAGVDDVLHFADRAWDADAHLGSLSLMGDSAGGGLALVVLAHWLAQNRRPHRVALASPATWLDPDRAVPPAKDLLFPLSILRRIGRDYGAGADPNDPRLSPRFADFANPPPTLIHCALGEYLEEDTDLIAARLADCGGDVTVEKAPKAPHVWHFMGASSPLAMDALGRMADFAKADP